MDYEELYGELQPLEKKMKEMAAAAQKLQKTIVKDTENGDIKDLGKTLSAYSELMEGQKALVSELQGLVERFDGKEYLQSGDFSRQMLSICQEKGVDVTGEYPAFEMFPYRVKFDTENQDIYLDRKRVQSLRPASFVQMVKKGQEKLMKAPFNAASFLNELAEAYDITVLKQNRASGTDIYLINLYKQLVPMGRSRKEYDQQNFAFDLARLYMSETERTKDGRRYQFGPNRESKKAIRILHKDGREEYLATIRFFADEKEEAAGQ